MPKNLQKRVVLEQHCTEPKHRYYVVVRLYNVTEPAIGAQMKQSEVQNLIQQRILVEIRPHKK